MRGRPRTALRGPARAHQLAVPATAYMATPTMALIRARGLVVWACAYQNHMHCCAEGLALQCLSFISLVAVHTADFLRYRDSHAQNLLRHVITEQHSFPDWNVMNALIDQLWYSNFPWSWSGNETKFTLDLYLYSIYSKMNVGFCQKFFKNEIQGEVFMLHHQQNTLPVTTKGRA